MNAARQIAAAPPSTAMAGQRLPAMVTDVQRRRAGPGLMARLAHKATVRRQTMRRRHELMVATIGIECQQETRVQVRTVPAPTDRVPTLNSGIAATQPGRPAHETQRTRYDLRRLRGSPLIEVIRHSVMIGRRQRSSVRIRRHARRRRVRPLLRRRFVNAHRRRQRVQLRREPQPHR